MTAYQGNIVIKNPATPAGPFENGAAPGVWKLNEALAFKRQGIWPTQGIQGPDPYFEYVSMLLTTTALSNANNNLFVDSSGAFNPISRLGNTTQGAMTPYGANWSNYFDGSGDYLSVPNNAAFSYGTGDFTMEAWVYKSGSGSTAVVDSFTSGGGGTFGFLVNDTQVVGYQTNVVAYTFTYTVPRNTWTHIAFVRTGGNLICYVNGTSIGSQANSTNFTSSNAIVVGRNAGSGGDQWLGYISNLRIVKGTAVYTSAFTPSTVPLTAISGTSLLTCQSNRFRDASANSFAVTVSGDPRVTDFSPFSPVYPGMTGYNQNDITNWSGYFDGVTDYLSAPTNAVFGYGTGDFTIEFWMYLTGTPDQTIISNLPSASGTNPHIYYSAGTIRYYTASADRITSGSIVVGQWYHVALCRASGSTRMFVNGTQAGSTYADTNNYGSSAPLGIATYWNGASPVTTNTFTGYMSNARIVKGTALYTSNFTPPTTNLTAVSGTSVLTCQSAAFADNSTNNLALTQGGNPTVTGNSPFNTVGYWSNYFDGSGDYLSLADSAALQMSSGDFTVEFWWNPVSISGYQTPFEKGYTGSGAILLQTGNGDGKIVVYASGSAVITASTAVTVNAWNHMALVRNGTSLVLYLNGVSVGSAVNSTNFNSAGAVGIGANVSGGGAGAYPVNGYMSNVRVVKGTAVYTAAFTPPTAPLTAITNTSLLTCQNGRFIDNSTNNFAITVTGNTSVQSFDPFYASTVSSNGGSLYFDGSGDYLVAPYNPTLNILSGDFTVESWIYPTQTSGFVPFFGQWQQTAGLGGFIVGASGANFNFNFGPFSTGAAMITASTTFAPNAWYHVAITRSGSNFVMYVNGVSVGTASSSATLAPINVNFSMGNYYSASGTFPASGATDFAGYLSGTRIVKGAALYTGAFTPPTAPANPTAATTLLINGMNAGIYDASAVNDLETVGNAQVTTAVSKFGGSSMYFDGTGDYLTPRSTPDLDFGSGDFTVEFWAYPTVTTNVVDAAFGYGNFTLMCYHNGTNWTAEGSNNGSSLQFQISTPVTLNTWQLITITRSGTTITLFKDGVVGATGSLTGAINTAGKTLRVGDNGNSQFFTGYLDEFRITKGVARYTSNFTPPTQAFPPY